MSVKLTEKPRVNFASIKNPLPFPDFLEVQLKSFKDFLQLDTPPELRKDQGLYKVFAENFPIADTRNNFVLEFLDYYIDPPRYSIDECLERGLTYSVPLKAKLKLYCTDPDHEDFATTIQDVYLGPIPYMTEQGTFIINGAERVVVSQLHRSPGVFFGQSTHANGTKLYSARIIPFRGSWIEFATDINNVMYAYIDRKKKLPVTTLLRAIGLESDKDIIQIFDLAEEIKVTKTNLKNSVGRKLAARVLNSWVEDFVDEDTGEVVSIERNTVVVDRGSEITEDVIDAIMESGVKTILLEKENVNTVDYSIIFNTLQKDTSNSEKEAVQYIYRQLRNAEPPDDAAAREVIQNLFFSEKRYDLGEVGRYRINKKLELDTPMDVKVLTREDIIAIIKYLIELINAKSDVDDIDHLSNRRVRTVGEQLYNQFGVGLARISRSIREKMNVRDNEVFTPTDLINAKTISAVINTFFGTNALSQFMDQTNPAAELTHKRKLSALGPGGLNRERATFDVRDVHHSHYGRLCPIETPEGQNIGLISSLATFSKVNEYGFIMSPYRKVEHTLDAEGKVIDTWVTDHVDYLTADEEDRFIVAQANEPLDITNRFENTHIGCRHRDLITQYTADKMDYMDVSPKQLVSVATALIPFLENDDTNRALMGSNMQRQAVPLMKTESAIVATGIEHAIARDSGVMVRAKNGGVAVGVASDCIKIQEDDGLISEYPLKKFQRSNQGTCLNQRPLINTGDRVSAGEIIADGPATNNGELALGKNILIGYMEWEGYNYEDAILISEKLVQDDVFTSIHIEEHETEARDTKLGAEEITRDIPNVSEDALKDLDADGIIRVGAEVQPGDILVGKVTPKGETELTPEERLLRAIFGEKSREVRDTSLKVPHGEGGIVVDVKVFTRENKDELSPGVSKLVRVYIAQKRKIQIGDKMAGRHGNKGVISRVLPQADMPFLADGTPLQIVLNPLGVPSRMNIGQVLEVHLGLVCKQLGWKIATPVFDGATEQDIKKLFEENNLLNPEGKVDGKIQVYDGRTGEPFENRVTVGVQYMIKLNHLVDDKIHARSIGPYSLVTQQPLGGKAQFGGQRFGEMEVWALEAYGAAHILQEILTVKSDDIVGRVKTYESIVKGNNISEPGIPEAFKVLLKELQSLALDVKVLTESGEELVIRELDDDDDVIPTAKAREAQELDDSIPVTEFDITGDADEEELELEPISIFDNDEDDFTSKELFSGDELDDFDDEDDDLGDKFTLFDEDDEDEDDLDLFGDDGDKE